MADLGGKTVAIPVLVLDPQTSVLQALLKANGLTPVIKRSGDPAANEVQLIVMAPGDMPPALATGRVAGYIVAEPFDAQAETLGIGKYPALQPGTSGRTMPAASCSCTSRIWRSGRTGRRRW